MPKRFIKYSRTEPARTILFVIAAFSGLAQILTLTPWIPPVFLLALPNAVIVGAISTWGLASAYSNSAKHMALSSFWMFAIWAWSGVLRLLIAPDPSNLMWVPFLIIAAVMGVVYLYLSYQRRLGDLD